MCVVVFFVFWQCPQHVKVPRPGIESAPQQRPEPQQWQHWVLNPLSYWRTPDLHSIELIIILVLWYPSLLVCARPLSLICFYIIMSYKSTRNLKLPGFTCQHRLPSPCPAACPQSLRPAPRRLPLLQSQRICLFFRNRAVLFPSFSGPLPPLPTCWPSLWHRVSVSVHVWIYPGPSVLQAGSLLAMSSWGPMWFFPRGPGPDLFLALCSYTDCRSIWLAREISWALLMGLDGDGRWPLGQVGGELTAWSQTCLHLCPGVV